VFFLSALFVPTGAKDKSRESSRIPVLHVMTQVATAFCLRKKYWEQLSKKNDGNNTLDRLSGINLVVAEVNQYNTQDDQKIDINKCSKNDLVHKLGLPIVYANDIDLLRTEGYIFTHIEELSDLVGIPVSYIKNILPLLRFDYDINAQIEYSWKRVNTYSLTELVASGVSNQSAAQIIKERSVNGEYKSLLEIKKRTGLSFDSYRQLVYHS
jgi:DNA uptake protein ComE-like DNA-binding protein